MRRCETLYLIPLRSSSGSWTKRQTTLKTYSQNEVRESPQRDDTSDLKRSDSWHFLRYEHVLQFFMACLTYSWNTSGDAEFRTMLSSTATRLSARLPPLSEDHSECPHPAMHGRMLPTRRGDCTMCFSDLCTAWLPSSAPVLRKTMQESPRSNPSNILPAWFCNRECLRHPSQRMPCTQSWVQTSQRLLASSTVVAVPALWITN